MNAIPPAPAAPPPPPQTHTHTHTHQKNAFIYIQHLKHQHFIEYINHQRQLFLSSVFCINKHRANRYYNTLRAIKLVAFCQRTF